MEVLLGFHSNENKNTYSDSVEVCICCSSKEDLLISVKMCDHTGFLFNYIKYKLELDLNLFLCRHCHHMLRKIELFKQQVEDSVALLTNQANILKVNKLTNLICTEIEVNSNEKPVFEVEVEIKDETINDSKDIIPDLNTDVKIEKDYDFDGDEPLASLKTRKQRKRKLDDAKYNKKIVIIMMTMKQMEEEREEMRRKEGYLKLPFKCESCILGFDHERTLKRHMETRHKKTKNKFQCEICQSVLGFKRSFEEHMRRHVRRYECLVCKRRFTHTQSAMQHYDERHAAPGAFLQAGFTCQDCGFTTPSNRLYRYHMDKHKKKSVCKICGQTFVYGHGLRVHIYTVHQKSSSPYKCTQCEKSYRAKSGLYNHTKMVHGPKGTQSSYCTACKKHYKTEAALLHHLRTNSKHITEKDKKYICNDCGARFILKESLRNHINWTHLMIEHQCSLCLKGFKNPGQLRKHISFVHDKIRPPQNKICQYCGRGFTTNSILESHIRTHTGERPLRCGRCPASFAHSAALYTHNKLVHAKALT